MIHSVNYRRSLSLAAEGGDPFSYPLKGWRSSSTHGADFFIRGFSRRLAWQPAVHLGKPFQHLGDADAEGIEPFNAEVGFGGIIEKQLQR